MNKLRYLCREEKIEINIYQKTEILPMYIYIYIYILGREYMFVFEQVFSIIKLYNISDYNLSSHTV